MELKQFSILGLLIIQLSICSAYYSFVPKQFDDFDWYMIKSNYFDTDFTTARSACASYNLVLAEIRASADYDYLANLFCVPNSFRIYQFWINLEWDGAPVTYKWPSDNSSFGTNKELPSGQSQIEEFFCPNITLCGPNCARATVVQINCNSMTSTMFCSYQNEQQKYILCNNPNLASVTYSLYTTPVDGTLVTNAYTGTPAPVSSVEKAYSDNTWDIIRYPDCDLSFSEAQQVCSTYGGGSYLSAIDSDADYDTFLNLFRPTDPRIVRMDIWVNAQYDYSKGNFVWLTNGQNVTQFPKLLQDWIVVANGSWNYTYNWTLENGINYDFCGNYNGPRGLKLMIRFDANYSVLYCSPTEASDVCYALCKNYTASDLLNVTIVPEITTTTPSLDLSTNIMGGQVSLVYSSSCDLTIFDARKLCESDAKTLAILTTSNDFLGVLDVYRPNPNTFAIYQFWIDAQYDYENDTFRWVTTGDPVYLPYSVQIYTDQCGVNYGDYRGVILKIEFPHNRYYLYCLPYNVPQCYGLCMNQYIAPTTNSYAYQRIGKWEEWSGWTNCYMIKYFLYRNQTYMKKQTVDCDYIWLQNETDATIENRAEQTLIELDNIKKQTEKELAALSEKFKVMDSVGDSFSIITMIIVGAMYAWVIILDILKIVMKKKEPEKKKDKSKKSSKNKKRKQSRKNSKLDGNEAENKPRTSRSRGNSIINNGKRYSIELLENVARRVSFDSKMMNTLLKPLAKSQAELLAKVKSSPSNSKKPVIDSTSLSSKETDRDDERVENFTEMGREPSNISGLGPLNGHNRQKSTLKPPEPKQSRRKSIEMNVMSRLRRLSNVMAAYRHPHEDFAKEKEYTQTLSDYFGTNYDPKANNNNNNKKSEVSNKNSNGKPNTKSNDHENPAYEQEKVNLPKNSSKADQVDSASIRQRNAGAKGTGLSNNQVPAATSNGHYDTSNSILNGWYGKSTNNLNTTKDEHENDDHDETQPNYDTNNSILNSWYGGKSTNNLNSTINSQKNDLERQRSEVISVNSHRFEPEEVKVENELSQSKSSKKTNKKKEKVVLEANANTGDFKRYLKRVSYANTKLDKPNSLVIIDKS